MHSSSSNISLLPESVSEQLRSRFTTPVPDRAVAHVDSLILLLKMPAVERQMNAYVVSVLRSNLQTLCANVTMQQDGKDLQHTSLVCERHKHAEFDCPAIAFASEWQQKDHADAVHINASKIALT